MNKEISDLTLVAYEIEDLPEDLLSQAVLEGEMKPITCLDLIPIYELLSTETGIVLYKQ